MSHKKLKLKEFNNKIVRFNDQDIVDIDKEEEFYKNRKRLPKDAPKDSENKIHIPD